MKRLYPRWGAALALLLAAAAPARAELVEWQYSWSSSPSVIAADSGGSSGINLFSGKGGKTIDGKDLTAVQFEAFGATPATFTNAGYSATLHLTDGSSGKSGSLTFTGLLNGTMTADVGDLTHKFTSESSQMLNLSGNQYTVTLGAFTPPGPPGSGVRGSLQADVLVSSGGPVNEVPEPASALLAGLGAAALGLKCWRGRRR